MIAQAARVSITTRAEITVVGCRIFRVMPCNMAKHSMAHLCGEATIVRARVVSPHTAATVAVHLAASVKNTVTVLAEPLGAAGVQFTHMPCQEKAEGVGAGTVTATEPLGRCVHLQVC